MITDKRLEEKWAELDANLRSRLEAAGATSIAKLIASVFFYDGYHFGREDERDYFRRIIGIALGGGAQPASPPSAPTDFKASGESSGNGLRQETSGAGTLSTAD